METLTIDKNNGVVQHPHFHDASLKTVIFQDKSVSLIYTASTKQILQLFIQGLIGLSMDNLYENNIVFEIRVFPVSAGQHEDFLRIFHRTNDGRLDDSFLNKFKSETLLFVQIIPTLGADILALCSDVKWQYLEEP